MDETPRSKGYEMVECLFVEEKKEVYNSRGLPSSFHYVVLAVGAIPRAEGINEIIFLTRLYFFIDLILVGSKCF